MERLRFLILSKPGANRNDLEAAIQKRGHELYSSTLDEAKIEIAPKRTSVFFGKHPLSDFDIIIPRTIGSNLRLGRFILNLVTHDQYVLDATIRERDTFGKASQAHDLNVAGLRHPATYYISKTVASSSFPPELSFPIVAKPVVGSQGYGVMLLHNHDELNAAIKNLAEDYLFQEYLPIKFDYRIFVVGEKVLGGIKRFSSSSDFRSNVSVGGRAEPAHVDEELSALAIKATKIFGYDLAGVDIAVVGETPYVLEVNRSPQWQGLKKTLGIDPADAIIEYCIKEYTLLNKK